MLIYKSPIGLLKLSVLDGFVAEAVFIDEKIKGEIVEGKIKKALDNYFETKKDMSSDIFLFPEKFTEFQQNVFREILKVSFGQTITYQQIAKNIGKPNAYRAVAGACSKNPLALFIPCHRVVRSQNEDYGYSWGKERKEWLLGFESLD